MGVFLIYIKCVTKVESLSIVEFQDSIKNFNSITSKQLATVASKCLDRSKTILIGKV